MAQPAANRAMLLTPPGAAAIAVVRLAGPQVGPFLGRHFSPEPRPGRCVHGLLRDGQDVLDDALVVLDTGGRFADLNIHGGPWVVRSVLELAGREGFALASSQAGAVAEDAIDADDPIERETLAHLPLAGTDLGIEMLLAQPRAWASLMEELGALSPPRRRQRARAVLADRCLHWLLHPPRLAILGIANVGKSTLANQLFARERSITADLPGTTRDWVGEMANLDGLPVLLIDTPGLRPTEDPIERAAQQSGREQAALADARIVVLDTTQPLEPDQSALVETNPGSIVVANKVDRPCVWPRGLAAVAGAIPMVATSGQGVDALMRKARARFGCEGAAVEAPRCWTPRQRELLERM